MIRATAIAMMMCFAACNRGDYVPEMGAIATSLKIHETEQRYHSESGRYGNLTEIRLRRETLWPGYTFELTVTTSGLRGAGKAATLDSGWASFIPSNERGQVHQCWQDRPANIAGEILK